MADVTSLPPTLALSFVHDVSFTLGGAMRAINTGDGVSLHDVDQRHYSSGCWIRARNIARGTSMATPRVAGRHAALILFGESLRADADTGREQSAISSAGTPSHVQLLRAVHERAGRGCGLTRPRVDQATRTTSGAFLLEARGAAFPTV